MSLHRIYPDERKFKERRKLCKRCKWSTDFDGSVACFYLIYAKQSPITRDGIDLRGDDLTKCKLYEKGKKAKIDPYSYGARRFG